MANGKCATNQQSRAGIAGHRVRVAKKNSCAGFAQSAGGISGRGKSADSGQRLAVRGADDQCSCADNGAAIIEVQPGQQQRARPGFDQNTGHLRAAVIRIHIADRRCDCQIHPGIARHIRHVKHGRHRAVLQTQAVLRGREIRLAVRDERGRCARHRDVAAELIGKVSVFITCRRLVIQTRAGGIGDQSSAVQGERADQV